MNLNFYKILHCRVNDSQSIIKKNYYKLCRKYHPDRNKNNTEEHIKKIIREEIIYIKLYLEGRYIFLTKIKVIEYNK